ncbi:hypothetical protein PHISCL_04885 [Aspergillus sclerotialis]|uniref:Uncharacterized protein n=1 Tax=Aspergillus sclerotialis TaxID=2070753 RepID=A0A3A2ZI52_9EURO|nr:hypothetical protein PHISCL_04885 [Aspergillus sclerotialis]
MSKPNPPGDSQQTNGACQLNHLQLFHHSLITTNPDALKFYAAASLQLPSSKSYPKGTKSDTRLVSSPYNSPPHLLDLTTLDTPSQLLAKALTIFTPIRNEYATAPYIDSFNWDAVFVFLKELSAEEGYIWTKQEFYVVVFRSRLSPDVDVERLHELDVKSHEEATVSGGLLKYWFGSKNEQRENLATCIWRNRDDAHRGGLGPWHRRARGAAREMYEQIDFTMLRLEVGDGVASWEIRDWTDE